MYFDIPFSYQFREPSEFQNVKTVTNEERVEKTLFWKRILKSISFYYFYFAFVFGLTLYGQCITLIEEFSNAENIIDYIFIFYALGGFTSSSLAPRIIALFTQNDLLKGRGMNCLIICLCLMVITSRSLMPTIPHFSLVILLMYVEGFVFCFACIAGVVSLKWIWGGARKYVIFGFYCMYPFASFMSPAITSVVFGSDLSLSYRLKIPYYISVALVISCIFPFLLYTNPSPEYLKKLEKKRKLVKTTKIVVQQSKKEKEKENNEENGEVIKNGCCSRIRSKIRNICKFSTLVQVIPNFICNICNGFCVYSLNNLMFLYLSKGLHYSDSKSSMISSIYYISSFAGRLASVFLSNYFTSPQYLSLNFIGGFWGTIMIWWFGHLHDFFTIFGVSVNGICVASQFPLYYSFIYDTFGFELTNTGIASFSWSASIGKMYPSLTSLLMKRVSMNIWVAFITVTYFICFVIVMGTIIFGWVYKREKSKSKKEKNKVFSRILFFLHKKKKEKEKEKEKEDESISDNGEEIE